MSPLFVALVLAASPRPLQLAVPEGWVDLGPKAPPNNFEQLPPEMVAQLKKAGFVAVAFDFLNATPTFATNFNATLDAVPLPDPVSNFDVLKKSYVAAMEKAGFVPTIRSARPVVIDDVTCGEIVSDNTAKAGQVTQLVYLMPVGERTLTVTYSAEPDRFGDYEKQFRQAALLTTGLEKAPGFNFTPLLAGALGVGVLGALAAGFFTWRKRRAA